jgi:glycosyltransferase involved in cell wall biosynthesis
MKDTPMISIIIPTLNEAGVIGQTVGFLKSHFTLPHEIIVSDGKSTDATAGIARQAGATVVAYAGEKRQTIAQGRNDGVRASQGDYIAFMDADCHIPDPEAFFKRAIGHFERDPRTVALSVSIRVLPEMETFSDKLVFSLFNRYLQILNNVFKQGMAAGEFQMMRRSAFEQVGGFNEALVASEDVDLFNRLSKVGLIVFDHGLVIYHTGRRAHKIGWPRLLSTWIANTVSMWVSGKAHSKEWTVIR